MLLAGGNTSDTNYHCVSPIMRCDLSEDGHILIGTISIKFLSLILVTGNGEKKLKTYNRLETPISSALTADVTAMLNLQ